MSKNNFGDRIKKISKNAKELNGSNEVSFVELFDKSFMNEHTNFSSFEELLESGNFIVNSPEDFEAIPDKEFDVHINTTTKFSSWEEMYSEAAADWALKNLLK